MSIEARTLELWCDSFHEGIWAADGIVRHWPEAVVTVSYDLGFIPRYTISAGIVELNIVVYGGYGNWNPLPDKVRELIAWGKPDIVGFDRAEDTILFAVEETAAVPTGNQALQRCERMHGAAKMGVPFWYLLSQFGTHIDQGTRQASTWPALMAVALSVSCRLPSVVLLYSSALSPEDYSAGEGGTQLFDALSRIVVNFASGRSALEGLDADLTLQYRSLLGFVQDTYANVTDFLPHREELERADTAALLARIATRSDGGSETFPLLDWPPFSDLPAAFRERQAPASFIKPDPFLLELEQAKSRHAAYTLSGNAGSRPQPAADLERWIRQQNRLHSSAVGLLPPVDFSMAMEQFPESRTGRHVTTAKNVLYLVDSAKVVFEALRAAYPRLESKLPDDLESPALVYVSNSIKPFRIFGDPFTGQFAAFSWIFGGVGASRRTRFAYFPHQSHGVLAPDQAHKNKGQLIFLSLADYLIFHSGAVYSVAEQQWL